MFIYKLNPTVKFNRASILGIKIDKIQGVRYDNKQIKFLPFVNNKTLIEINTDVISKKSDDGVQKGCTPNQTKKEIVTYIMRLTKDYEKKELNKKSKNDLVFIANNLGV